MIQWFKNFIESPSTTIQGVIGGGVILAVFGYAASELHCDWSLFSWTSLVAFIVPVLIGGGAGSSAKPVTPTV